eukprot:s1284_g5.t1
MASMNLDVATVIVTWQRPCENETDEGADARFNRNMHDLADGSQRTRIQIYKAAWGLLSAWEKLHARFDISTEAAAPTGPAKQTEPRQVPLEASTSKEPIPPPKAFSLPPYMRPSAAPSLCFKRIAVAVAKPIAEVGAATAAVAGEPSPAAKELPLSAADDLKKPALSPTPPPLSVDEPATELPKSFHLKPTLRPSATPSLCFRRLPERKGPEAS